MICPKCQKSNITNTDIFCPSCGESLSSISNVKNNSITKNDDISQSHQSVNNSLELTPEIISVYKKLTQKHADLSEVPHQLDSINKKLPHLESELSNNKRSINNLRIQLNLAEKEVLKYEKKSISHFISLLNGTKNQKIQKNKEHYSMLLNKIEKLEKDIVNQKNELNVVRGQQLELQQLNQSFENNQEALNDLINQITKGITNPNLSKIETDLQTLTQQKELLEKKLDNSKKILRYLTSTISDLNEAYVQLNIASSYGRNFSLFLYNTASFDKRYRIENARILLTKAGKNINLAGNIDLELSDVNAVVNGIRGVWAPIMDENYSGDILNDVRESLESFKKTVFSIKNNCLKIENGINSIEQEILILTDKISDIQDSMTLEKQNIIEKSLNQN